MTLAPSATAAVIGQPVTLTATVTPAAPGAGVPTGAVTFFDGGTTLGIAALDAAGQAVLAVDGLGSGVHTITAAYGGDSERTGSQSVGAAVSVVASPSRIILVPHAVLKKKKVVSLSLTAEVEPLTAGGGVPTGRVTFVVKNKALGIVALSGGAATIALKPGGVLGKSITVTYAGDADFLPASVISPQQTTASLRTLARAATDVVRLR